MTAVAANGTRHGVLIARSSSPSPPEEGDLAFSHTTQGRNTKTHLTHGRSVFSEQGTSVQYRLPFCWPSVVRCAIFATGKRLTL